MEFGGTQMDDSSVDIRRGVKTFFVVPDHSLLPEDNLKAFFLKGYETYFLDDDPYCALAAKIRLLVESFSELILFFNIDRSVSGIDWPVFIRTLQKNCGDRVIIGVMCQKRNNPEEMRYLERLYLFEIGIVGGCIPLEYQKNKNMRIVQNVLMANKANGQRKHIRAICNDSFKLNMQYKGSMYRCLLRDISTSHFSCVFADAPPDMPVHEKIANMQMNLHGVLCNVNGLLCLKRECAEGLIHVFIFLAERSKSGLNPEQLSRVNTIVFNTLQTAIRSFLDDLFALERQNNPASRTRSSSLEALARQGSWDTAARIALESLG